MPPTPQRQNTGPPDPCDSIAEMFSLPRGQWRAPQDAPPAAPKQSGRLHPALSWLWRFVVDGFAACSLAMYPCFEDPSDPFDVLSPWRCEPVQQATVAPAEQSTWQFEDLARGTMTVRLRDDITFAEIEPGAPEQGTGKSGAR